MCTRKSRAGRALALSLAAGSAVLASREALAVNFILNPASGMDPQAVAGFNAATARWANVLSDNVTIRLDVDFGPLGAGVLGSTSTTKSAIGYSTARTFLNNKKTSADDISAVAALQTGSVKMLLNRTSNSPNGANSPTPYFDSDGDNNNTTIFYPQAVGRAWGLVSSAITFRDGQVAFSNDPQYTWDFNPNDGITPGSLDFVGIAAHEIGHALGFTSGVDKLDQQPNLPDNAYNEVSPMDLFRFSTQSVSTAGGGGVGVIDMTADTRDKYFSVDGGVTKIASFSTGLQFGDGRQASHWKDGIPPIGLLDPTGAPGEMLIGSALDYRLMDVIGWTISPNAVSNWTATGGGTFSDTSKWASSNVPDLGKDAHFNVAGTYLVNLTANANAGNAFLRNGTVTFNLAGNSLVVGTLNVAPNSGETNSTTVSGGSLWANYVIVGRAAGGSTANLSFASGMNITTVGGIGVNTGGALALNGVTVTGGAVSLNGGNVNATGTNSLAGLSAVSGAIAVAGTTTVNGTFKVSGTLQKTGAGSLVIGGPQSHGTGAVLTHSAGTLVLSSNAGDATTANLQLNSAATTTLNASQNLSGLNITGGMTALSRSTSGPSKSLKTRSLSITNGGTLDLTNNRLIIDYTGASELGTWSNGAYTKVLGLLQSGRNGGSWDGPGIITSETQAGDSLEYTMLAAGEASQILGISGTQTKLWGDQTVDATSVLVKYTYGGDANLDGMVDIDDYSQLDLGDLLNLRGYTNGDFNFDGLVDIDDYGMIDFTVMIQQGQLLSGQGAGPVGLSIDAVPEPGSVSLLLLGGATMLRRRRARL